MKLTIEILTRDFDILDSFLRRVLRIAGVEHGILR